MKRKLLSLLYAVLPFRKRYERITIDGIEYDIDMSGHAAQVRGSRRFAGHCVIPSAITYIGNDYEVKSIAKKAFWRCDGLVSVSIPDHVSAIGEAAFWGCRNLASVEIPASIESIGLYAFNYCESLDNVHYDSESPKIVDDRIFDASLYTKAALHVPESGEAEIRKTAPWRYFKNIVVGR